MAGVDEKLREVTKNLLQKRLYIIFTTPVKPMEELFKFIDEHLAYIRQLEEREILFAAGPFFEEKEEWPGSGMLIVRAGSFAEADAIAREDPFHNKGLRKYEIKGWQLNEGSFNVTLHYSQGTFEIG